MHSVPITIPGAPHNFTLTYIHRNRNHINNITDNNFKIKTTIERMKVKTHGIETFVQFYCLRKFLLFIKKKWKLATGERATSLDSRSEGGRAATGIKNANNIPLKINKWILMLRYCEANINVLVICVSYYVLEYRIIFFCKNKIILF